MAASKTEQSPLEFVTCNLCGEENDQAIRVIDGWKIVNCRSCGFSYLNPRPQSVKHNFDDVDTTRWQRRASQDTTARRLFFTKQLSDMEAVLGEERTTKRLLDFGCGTGQFLDLAKDRGWETYGLEPDPLAKENEQRGHGMFIGQLPDADVPTDFFDAIFCSAVFEHVDDPFGQLVALRKSLKPGGILVITSVPNFGSATIRLGIANFYAQSPPGDLNFFTPKTMAKMATKADLSVIQASSYGFDYNSFIKRRKTGASPSSPKAAKPAPKLPEGLLKLGVSLYGQIGLFGLGSKIHVIARRSN